MNKHLLPASLIALAFATGARAEAPAGATTGTSAPSVVRDEAAPPPQMSEIPKMKQQGERMAVLMEQLSKESDPEIRRKIMAEAMCPQ